MYNKQYHKKYYEKNKEHIKELVRKNYFDNIEKRSEYRKAYYERNKDTLRVKHRVWFVKYYKRNKELISQKAKQWREEHKDYEINRKKEWYNANKKEILDRQKASRDSKAREFGFINRLQHRRYDCWCKKNGIALKSDEYIGNIQNWLENIDSGGYKKEK